MEVLARLRERWASDHHDLPALQRELYRLASDPALLLTAEQRGALNWLSSRVALTWADLRAGLDYLLQRGAAGLTASDSAAVPPVLAVPPALALPEDPSWDVVVYQTPAGGYQWSLLLLGALSRLSVDTHLASTPTEAQQRADAFLARLNQGEPKAWLHVGLVYWAQQASRFQGACQAEVLTLRGSHYLVVVQRMPTWSAEAQNAKTVHFTHKVLGLESWVDPRWVARGYLPSGQWFYVVYKVKVLPALDTAQTSLTSLLC